MEYHLRHLARESIHGLAIANWLELAKVLYETSNGLAPQSNFITSPIPMFQYG